MSERTLERYQHLSPVFRAQTVDLIAQVLFSDTRSDTPAPREEQDGANWLKIGGVDGTRTRSVSDEKRSGFAPAKALRNPDLRRDLMTTSRVRVSEERIHPSFSSLTRMRFASRPRERLREKSSINAMLCCARIAP